jgi:hypothetical protein
MIGLKHRQHSNRSELQRQETRKRQLQDQQLKLMEARYAAYGGRTADHAAVPASGGRSHCLHGVEELIAESTRDFGVRLLLVDVVVLHVVDVDVMEIHIEEVTTLRTRLHRFTLSSERDSARWQATRRRQAAHAHPSCATDGHSTHRGSSALLWFAHFYTAALNDDSV